MAGESMTSKRNDISISMGEIIEELQTENSALRLDLMISKKMIEKLRNVIIEIEDRVEKIPVDEVEVLKYS